MKKNKGITLIALVITIIVLLILAGITINMVLSDEGIMEKAQEAGEKSKEAEALEDMQLKMVEIDLAVREVKIGKQPTLQEIADKFVDKFGPNGTNEIENIELGKEKTASTNNTEKINVLGYESIYIKLKKYSYEFEVKENLKVAIKGKVDDTQVAEKPNNNENLLENTVENPQPVGDIVALKDGWGIESVSYIKTSDGSTATVLSKVATVYAVSVGNGETVPVPGNGKDKGFYYVGGTIDTGVIISDNIADKYDGKVDKTTHEYATELKGNQFVWIPCKIEEYAKIDFEKEGSGKWDKETNAAEYTQVEKYGGFYIGRYEAGVSTLNENTNTFEDSVTFVGGESLFEEVELQKVGWQNYNFIARGNLITDTNYPNKATGNIVEKANSIPYYHADYYTAVEMSRRLYNNDYVNSGLVTGTQWDMMMKYLSDKSDYSDVKSTAWGNYDDVSLGGTEDDKKLRGYYTNTSGETDGFKKIEEGFTTNSGSGSYVLLTTGSTKQVLKKGLYDVAGNLWEWTQETSYGDNIDYNKDIKNNSYMVRGAGFASSCVSRPVCYREWDYAVSTNTVYGFRPVLYIK